MGKKFLENMGFFVLLRLLCLLNAGVTTAFMGPGRSPAKTTNVNVPSMFFAPKGEPVSIKIKTFNGVKTASGMSGQPLTKVMGSSGIIYGCKEGNCGTCEVKLDGRVVRTCVAKLPKKSEVT